MLLFRTLVRDCLGWWLVGRTRPARLPLFKAEAGPTGSHDDSGLFACACQYY